MNEVPARLIIKLGPNPEKEYSLSQPEITIGRSPGNSIVILSPEVSRRHARICRDGDSYLIEDWGSTNGTFVSGQRIMSNTILRHGNIIRLGDSITLLFVNVVASPTEVPILGIDPNVTVADTTPPQPPPDEAIPNSQTIPSAAIREIANDEFVLPAQESNTSRNRLRLIGCGCIFLLIPLLCAATLLFLDFYEQGRFLYCGPIRPFFEIFLGPIGFAPICP